MFAALTFVAVFAAVTTLQVRESQESIVLLDRTHTLKVQQVQKEYQEFMERIRNKAQVRRMQQRQRCTCEICPK
jgi:RNase P subunit RPR2